MKLALSTIALGVCLACASPVASSQTITVAQQGSGNTVAAEQVNATPDAVLYSSTTASITQIGNDNHVGGPGGTSGGIFQILSPHGGARAVVSQTGSGNNAGITQDGRPGGNPPPVEAVITQQGNGNDATIRQQDATSIPVTVDQTGTGNLARIHLFLNSGDTGVLTRQTGTGNRLTIEEAHVGYTGPDVTQDGQDNSATVTMVDVAASAPTIVQNGAMNSANTVQGDGGDSHIWIDQQGTGNRADATQYNYFNSAHINQAGNDNFASLTQSGGNKQASIAQSGNGHRATVSQSGPSVDYVANVSQTGSGNWTNVYQH